MHTIEIRLEVEMMTPHERECNLRMLNHKLDQFKAGKLEANETMVDLWLTIKSELEQEQ